MVAALVLASVAAFAVTHQNSEGTLELKQNFPNPFSGSTEIRYSIPAQGHVLLRVFNMLGQEVAVLVNESERSGDYKSRFEAAGLPSGQYAYTLVFTSDADQTTQKLTKKMYLVR